MRLRYPQEDISAELNNLLKHISRYAENGSRLVNKAAFEYLKDADIFADIPKAIGNIEDLIEVNFFEEAAV